MTISGFPDAERCSHDEMEDILNRLKLLLDNLPGQLPFIPASESKFHGFIKFSLDPDLLEKTGSEVSTLSEQLKRAFGWAARSQGDGIVPITERGIAINALHTVFADFLTRYPDDNVLKKWIIDVAKGAEKIYFELDEPIPTGGGATTQKRPRSESSSQDIPAAKTGKINAVGTASTRGRKPDSLISKLVTKITAADGKQGWRCVAPKCGHQQKGNLQADRILKHATSCAALQQHDQSVFDKACKQARGTSLGAQLANPAAVDPNDSPDKAQAAEPGLAAHVTGLGQLRMEPLLNAGKKSKGDRNQQFQKRVDHIIMRLICNCGLVPNIVDSMEWKELMNILNGTYKPSSANDFRNTIIPREAAFVRDEQIQLLRKEENLTLTFDGTSIRKAESFYSAHATTPARNSFFLDAHEGSGDHHNTEWIKARLLKTIESVGQDKWAAVVSDSTNVTKAARRETTATVDTMLDLRDCVHHLQNTIKDVTKIEAFKPLIRTMKGILKHFSKSSFSTAKLREVRNIAGEDGPVNSLQKIGKTRFGTYWLAANALDPCLPKIRELVIAKTIKFKNTQVQSMFVNRLNGKYQDCERHLLWYLSIVAPLIRSLWSLEAAHANASDVFVFWLAAAATLDDLFSKGEATTGIPRALANEITEIYNRRYAEFFQNDLYFVAFLLDPRYKRSDFLKKSQISVVIPSEEDRRAGKGALVAERPYDVVLRFLRNMLRPMLRRIEQTPGDDNIGHPLLRKKGISACVRDLSAQLQCFWNEDYPFRICNSESIKDPRKWWEEIARFNSADVLGLLCVRIFSILVNSMPDERTNSTITWLNSPIRGNLTSRSIVNMIQVGQWYGKHMLASGENKGPRYRPAVKFRVIDKDMLERLQTRSEQEQRELVGEMQTLQVAEDASDDEGDSDNDNDMEEQPTTSSAPVVILTAFKVNSHVDLKSAALRDMISEEPLVKERVMGPVMIEAPPRTSLHVSLSVDDAFAQWD